MEKPNDYKDNNFRFFNMNNQNFLNNDNSKNSENIGSNISQSNRSAPEINKYHNPFSEYEKSIKENNSGNPNQENYGLLKKLSEGSIKDENINNTIVINNDQNANQNNNNNFGNNNANNFNNNFNNNNIQGNNPNFNDMNNNFINNNIRGNNQNFNNMNNNFINNNIQGNNENFNNVNNFNNINNDFNNNNIQENNPNFNNMNKNMNINNNIQQNNPNNNNINNNWNNNNQGNNHNFNNINNNINNNWNNNNQGNNPNNNNMNNNWNNNNQGNNPNNNNINNNMNNNNMNFQIIDNQNMNNMNQNNNFIGNNNYPDDDPSIKNTRLSDLGKKSYLNSVLQCLGNIDLLRQYFLNKEIENGILSSIALKRLAFAIQRLFVHLNNFNNEIYKPDSILGVLQEKNIIFKQENYELNPNNCLNFILNALHDELNWKKRNNFFQSFKKYNEQEVIQVGKSNFDSANDSIISNTFSCFGLKEIRCANCRQRKYEFQNFLTFELDLLGFFDQTKKNRISIFDCLEYAIQKKIISNVYCEFCRNLNRTESLFSFIHTPEILIFMIDRGNFDKKLMDLNFCIDNEIGLEPYMTYKEPQVKYELRGIVSIYGNKYISFIKVDENFWYLFNDSRVKKVDNYDVINSNSSNGIKHIPCILFYKFIKKK